MARQNDHIRAEELISAYLDNQISAEEKTFFVRHTAGCASCRAQLEATRTMVAAMRAMPAVKAPRSFVLPREMARQPKPSIFKWYPALRLATVVAAIAFAIVFAGDLLSHSLSVGVAQPASVPEAARVPSVAEKPAQPAASAPTEVALGSAPAQAPAAAQPVPTQALAAAQPAPTPSAPAAGAALPAAGAAKLALTETMTMADSTTAAATSLPAATPAPFAQSAANQAQLSTEQSVPTATAATAAPAAPAAPATDLLRIAEIALLGLAIVLGVATFIVRRGAA